jgi:hypothetical protein
MQLNTPPLPSEIAGTALAIETTEAGAARLAVRSLGVVTEINLAPDQREQVARLLAGTAHGRTEFELATAIVRDAVGGL